jgi:hypothetical protein
MILLLPYEWFPFFQSSLSWNYLYSVCINRWLTKEIFFDQSMHVCIFRWVNLVILAWIQKKKWYFIIGSKMDTWRKHQEVWFKSFFLEANGTNKKMLTILSGRICVHWGIQYLAVVEKCSQLVCNIIIKITVIFRIKTYFHSWVCLKLYPFAYLCIITCQETVILISTCVRTWSSRYTRVQYGTHNCSHCWFHGWKAAQTMDVLLFTARGIKIGGNTLTG